MSTTEDHGDGHKDAQDDNDHEHNLELAPAPRPALVRETHSSEVYRPTALISPDASVVLNHSYSAIDPAMVQTSRYPSANELTVLHKTTVTVIREVHVVPGITLGYLSRADYIFVTTQLPVIVDEH